MGKLNIDKVKDRLSSLEKGSQDYEYMKLEDGENNVRIMPPKGDSDVWYVETAYHYGIGPNDETVCCPAMTPPEFGGTGKCPICDVVKKLRKSNDDDDKALVDDIRAAKRFFFNAINVDEGEKGIQVLPVGVTIFKEVLALISHPDYGDITDVDGGFNLIIKKKGKNRDTEYTVLARRNPSPISDIEDLPGDVDELLEAMTDLSEIPQIKSYKDIQGILEGEEPEDDDEDEDEAPKAKSKSKAKAEEPEDDEDEDEDEDDKSKSKAKAAPAKDPKDTAKNVNNLLSKMKKK